jgi:hypothetical protein
VWGEEREKGQHVGGATNRGFDVVYVGLLLGHGGDALQMLTLADGVRQRGVKVQIIVPAVPQSVSFARRCDDLGIACVRTDLLSVGMTGSRSTLRSLIRLLRSIDAPVVHFHTGDTCLPRRVLMALEVVRFRRAFITIQSPYETIVPGSARARSWSAAYAVSAIAGTVPPRSGGKRRTRRMNA